MVQTIVAVCLIMIVGAVRAQAQDTARSLSQLGAVGRYGDRIRLLDVNGHAVRGLIDKINESDIGLYLRKTHIRGIVPLSIALHSALCMPFGAGIDALMTRQQVIFERPGEPVTADETRSFAMQSPAPGKPSGFTMRF